MLLIQAGTTAARPLPLLPAGPKATEEAEPPSQYLLQFESSDISRLRADVQSLGFASLVK
jgi:hypothetical protein